MNMKRLNIISFLLLIFSGFFLNSCKDSSIESMMVITETQGNLNDHDYLAGDSWRFITKSRIVALDYKNLNNKERILTKDFYSACAPDISYDGKYMLFSGQKKEKDVWQIWEMNLENFEVQQITSSNKNCIDPVYLPGKRLLFSEYTDDDAVSKKGYMLFTSNLDGTDMNQITFNPNTYFASTIMKDGRILAITRQIYPNQTEAVFMALRPDGTKHKLFYKGVKGTEIHSGGREMENGKVYFIENDKNNKHIISVSYNRPLYSRIDISSGIDGDFYSVSSLEEGKLLTTYRSSTDKQYALYEFEEQNKALGKLIYKNENYNVIDAIVVKKHKRPRNLPSELNMSKNTGIIVCQDINFTDMRSVQDSLSTKKAVQIEVLGINSSLGKVHTEKDGSFYLKMLADTPFRIQTINTKGEVVNGPGSWIYLRPNERLGCVGCHEDNEQVPMNQQPLAVRKDPIILSGQQKSIHQDKSQ